MNPSEYGDDRAAVAPRAPVVKPKKAPFGKALFAKSRSHPMKTGCDARVAARVFLAESVPGIRGREFFSLRNPRRAFVAASF
jgi:hypothetical protein